MGIFAVDRKEQALPKRAAGSALHKSLVNAGIIDRVECRE